ncbi:MAG: hypothetical protein Q8M29_04855 [Bacteroidota bacterium]|nr:hypothetical protein [Bacteroidota bacterium]
MKAINQGGEPFNKGLTYEKLKQYKGFENITEEEAEEQITIIKKLAKILYYLYVHEEQKNKGGKDEN